MFDERIVHVTLGQRQGGGGKKKEIAGFADQNPKKGRGGGGEETDSRHPLNYHSVVGGKGGKEEWNQQPGQGKRGFEEIPGSQPPSVDLRKKKKKKKKGKSPGRERGGGMNVRPGCAAIMEKGKCLKGEGGKGKQDGFLEICGPRKKKRGPDSQENREKKKKRRR